MSLIEVHNLTKTYHLPGGIDVPVLKGVTLSIEKGELVALMGASGSGKSTLMNVLGFLDTPSGGEYRFDGRDVSRLSADERADLRAAAPRCELSVSVYGGYPACANNVGQDWMLWLDRGLADRAMPMNYVSDLAGLRGLMAKQTRHRDRLLCGIGASARESVLDVPALVDQLREAYAQGYRGAAVYAFDDRFLEEFVPALLLAQ